MSSVSKGAGGVSGKKHEWLISGTTAGMTNEELGWSAQPRSGKTSGDVISQRCPEWIDVYRCILVKGHNGRHMLDVR